jgi:hypothetical protein
MRCVGVCRVSGLGRPNRRVAGRHLKKRPPLLGGLFHLRRYGRPSAAPWWPQTFAAHPYPDHRTAALAMPCGPGELGKRSLQLVAGESARFKFRKVSDIGQHSGTLCALQTATGGLRCPGLKQRPQALFGLGALWRLACPNFRLSQRPLSLSGLGIVTGQRGTVVPP